MRRTASWHPALPLLLMLALGGCGEDTANGQAPKVLAEVNGTLITRSEMDFLREKMGAGGVAEDKRAVVEDKLLQTLVNRRAMALLAEQAMGKDEQEALAVEIAAHREELLVQRYLRANVAPEPVSGILVQAYYDKHPDEFGGGVERTFEVLSTTGEITGQARNELLKQLAKASQVNDWRKWAEREPSLSLAYKKATARVDVLDVPLSGLVRDTPVGKVSPVHTGKSIMIARVLEERKLVPRPLQEVSPAIRMKLAPVMLKEAVRKASAQAVANVKVNYREGTKPAVAGADEKTGH